jgi:hypothetical protein
MVDHTSSPRSTSSAFCQTQHNRTIDILKKKGWSPLRVTVFKCAEPVDIAVLIPPKQITVINTVINNDHLDPTSTGIAVGQDAYFDGFPCALHFAKTYSSRPRVFGFVKRATVAQLDTLPDRHLQRDSLLLLFSLNRG